MTTLQAYLPQDRLRALARGETLPNRTIGSALFADISGFTQLTESLQRAHGPRRGSEELTKYLTLVYSALITELEKYGGSVIAFAGDAMLCWFDEAHGPASPRAAVCAFAMQDALRAFASINIGKDVVALTLKVAITSGPARRFVVGDPEIQKMDLVVGTTVTRTSTAEHHAQKGDVILDEATVHALGDALTIKEWREDEESKERFAVVIHFNGRDTSPSLPVSLRPPAANKMMSWIPHAVYEREQFGEGSFLAGFRPCAVLFMRFTGIDYDSDSAESELDAFIQQAQRTAEKYEGMLIQITIGDKGSYLYICFGALSAHEDDVPRAVKTALALKLASSLSLQVGITQGTLRVGAYGGKTRRVFGALGDDVNLAARLMMTAAPDEILLSGHAHKAVEYQFTFEPRPPLLMKGKAGPLPVFTLTGERKQRAIRLQEPTYALPMVGRQGELQLINAKLELTLQAKSQIIGIVAEAGMGKSRLVAEVIRSARKKGFVGYGGACQSDGINTPYLAWKQIWQAFFDVDPSASLKKQLRNLEGELEDRVPERKQALPLLGVLLNLDIPENDFTKNLEPKYKQSALRAMLEDCLRAGAQDEPLLIVVEDLHWVDPLSHDLLEELARGLSDCRVCFVLAYRPPQLQRLQAPRLEVMPNFTRIELHELTQAEAEQAIRAKLAQLFPYGPAPGNVATAALVEKLMRRAQGNPFYLEELLNYLRDRGLDPREPQALEKIELPDSLHTLILSRIDKLSEHEKTTLRLASIIGRLFRVDWLTGYYPDLGGMDRVQADLDELAEMDITPLESPAPELAYLFKHIVTHEVTYESLPFATRAKLHEQLARYLENKVEATQPSPLLDTIAFHYGRSDNTAKKREYYQKAVEAALSVSAFITALEYSTRLLELTPNDDPARSARALRLGEAHKFLGDYPAARSAIAQAQAAAHTDTDRAAALALLGEMTSEMGDYAEAAKILAQVLPLARANNDKPTLCRALCALGDVNGRLGKPEDAQTVLNESLTLARELGDVTRELFALNRLGGVILMQGNLDEAERRLQEVHSRAVAVGNRERAMTAFNNLGVVAEERKDYAMSRAYYQQALALAREIGAQDMVALGLINSAKGDIKLGQLAAARAKLREGLGLALRLGTLSWVVSAVKNYAYLAHAEGQTERGLALLGLVRNHPAWSSDKQRDMDRMLAQWALDPSEVEAGLAKGAELNWKETIRELLADSG